MGVEGKRLGSRWLPMLALLRRELFERVRTVSHFVMRSLYVLLLFLVVVFAAWDSLFTHWDDSLTRAPEVGRSLFVIFSVVQFGLVVLVVPLIGAGAVVEEKVSRSLSLLLLTDLSYFQICLGKFLARLGVVTLIVLSNVPVLSFASVLGGVEALDVLRVFVLTLGMSAMLIGVTLAISASQDSTVRAALGAYLVVFALLLSLLLMIDDFVPHDWFLYWHAVVTLAIALGEPLNLGHAWWIAPLVNLAVGLGGVAAATALLSRGVRRARALSGEQAEQLVEPGRVWANPVAWREWARRGRPARAALLSLGVGVPGAIWILVERSSSDFEFVLIVTTVSVVLVAGLFAMAVGSSAFAQEKRENTLELLTLTAMRPREIVLGKLVSLARVWGYLCLVMAPSLAAAVVVEGDDVLLAALPLPFLTLGVAVLFIGSVGLFYGVVATTPLRAAFPSVATFIYVIMGIIWWPMLVLQALSGSFSEEVLFGLAAMIGWMMLFTPMLVLLARHELSRVWMPASWALVWCLLMLVLAVAQDGPWVVFGLHPFALVGSSVFMFIREGSNDEMLYVALVGSVMLGLAALVFLRGASEMLEAIARGGPREEHQSKRAAMVLSLLLPGAGQLYLGRTKRGAALMLGAMFTLSLGGLLNVIAAVDAWRLGGHLEEERRARIVRRASR